MNEGKICVSVCGETAGEVLAKIDQAADVADVIEVRFDCLLPDEILPLIPKLESTEKQLLITFRPSEQGGRRDLSLRDRIKFWERIASQLNHTDFLVDYEFDMDFPLQFAGERTIVSMHDFAGVPDNLSLQFETLADVTGKTIKIAVQAADATDAIAVWNLLEIAREKGTRVIPIAMGEAGKWTRILGLAHGAPMTYASLETGGETAPGQISAMDLSDVFRVRELDRSTEVYGLIAGYARYSLSPAMHNTAFEIARANAVFVPLQVADLDAFMRRMVLPETREAELNFRGFAVTNPHKQTVMNFLDQIDETARAIGAVNTISIDSGKLHGFNTDADGFIQPLKRTFGDLRDARVAVVGSGGASRACVFALKQEGADVTILARDPAKASAMADEFEVRVVPLTTADRPLATDILVNATPLGTRGPNENETVATADQLPDVKLVYDLVYNPTDTRLIKEAKAAGVPTLGGLDMLIAQGAKQFEIWTGDTPPIDAMRNAIESRLK